MIKLKLIGNPPEYKKVVFKKVKNQILPIPILTVKNYNLLLTGVKFLLHNKTTFISNIYKAKCGKRYVPARFLIKSYMELP